MSTPKFVAHFAQLEKSFNQYQSEALRAFTVVGAAN